MQVKVYSTKTCPSCKRVKAFFQERNIQYEDLDVGENEQARMDMIRKTGALSVPVIEVDDKIIIGFDEPELLKVLEIAKFPSAKKEEPPMSASVTPIPDTAPVLGTPPTPPAPSVPLTPPVTELSPVAEAAPINSGKVYEFEPGTWINSAGFKLSEMKGRVVLVHFWTFMCSDCRKPMDYVNAWYEKYHSQGLDIVGVHSPESSFEKELPALRQEVGSLKIKFPVLHDPDSKTWRVFEAHSWPDYFLFDKDGKLRFRKSGLGDYSKVEEQIRKLLL